MEPRAAVKVGITVLVGIALFLAVWAFLSHFSFHRYLLRVRFDDVKGLLTQSPVRMNGVKIGEVSRIDLQPGDLKPVVTLAIDQDRRIPARSRIRITSGLLISNPQVEIVPPADLQPSERMLTHNDWWPQENVEAEPLGALAAISPDADAAVRELASTLRALTPRVQSTFAQLEGILKRTDSILGNLETLTASTSRLIADPKIARTRDALLNDLQALAADARLTAGTLSRELRAVVKRNSSKLDQLADGAVDLLQNFADTVDAARGAVTRLTEQVSDPRLQQSLLETLDLLKTTIARFNQIASDIHQISGDPNVQSDLKTTVSTLKETTEEGQRLVERVNALLSRVDLPQGGPRFGIGKPGLSIDFLTRSDSPHFRSDVNVRLPIGDRNALNLGLYDFAESYKLTTQYETLLGNSASLRYGIYASKLGIGLDWQAAPLTRLVVDAHNPNRFQLDARALFHINDDFSIWFGADSLFRHTTPLFGVRLKR